jgi:hypothetical protein
MVDDGKKDKTSVLTKEEMDERRQQYYAENGKPYNAPMAVYDNMQGKE